MLPMHPWDTALVFGKVNLYYLTSTIQDGVLVLHGGGDVQFFVQLSFKRAQKYSTLAVIRPMKSYRDMRDGLPEHLGRTFVETDQVPLAVLDLLQNISGWMRYCRSIPCCCISVRSKIRMNLPSRGRQAAIMIRC